MQTKVRVHLKCNQDDYTISHPSLSTTVKKLVV